MPRKCVVAGCSNTHKDGVTTHLWPKNDKLALKWDRFVRLTRVDWIKGTTATTVCGAHFTPEDFDGYNQWKAGFGMRLRLKPCAVPTVHVKPAIATSVSDQPNITSRTSSVMKINRVENVTLDVMTKYEGCQYETTTCNITVPSPPRCAVVPLKHNVSTQAYYYREEKKNKAVQVWPIRKNVGVNTSFTEDIPWKEVNRLHSVAVYMARKYVVYEDCLLPLFKTCPVCRSSCSIDKFIQDTLLTINQFCNHCDHRSQWKSQPFNLPARYLSSSAAATSTGTTDASIGITTGTSTDALTDSSTGPTCTFNSQTLKTAEDGDLLLENYDGDICNKGLEDVFETTFCMHDDVKAMKKICQRQSLEEEEEQEETKEEEEQEETKEEEGSDVEWQPEVELSALLASDSEWDSRALCPDCGTFIKGSKAHVCEHAKPFVCQDCGKRFVNETSLNSHRIIHKPGYVHGCKYCLKPFQSRPEKLRHEECHPSVEKTYECPDCAIRFSDIKARDGHLQSHRGPTWYICDICKMEFTRSSYLERHMLVHSGEKPYTCPECQHSFNQASHLKSHMRLHTGERPYKCQHCDKYFNHNVSLKSHVQRYHPDPASGIKEKKREPVSNSDTLTEQQLVVQSEESRKTNTGSGQERVKRVGRKRKRLTFDPEELGESERNSDSDFNPGAEEGSSNKTTGRPIGRPRMRPRTTRDVYGKCD
ncbi:zinc finger protein 14-like [Salvelinus fontinalis]|uniref:zinc finger protein 14-like n=1 Tax=Salvelinus fontinalis TaxID=8038 RepID=UPI0024867F19|nr:zinc finger protein 14-like [Salvelinus fontinalis]